MTYLKTIQQEMRTLNINLKFLSKDNIQLEIFSDLLTGVFSKIPIIIVEFDYDEPFYENGLKFSLSKRSIEVILGRFLVSEESNKYDEYTLGDFLGG